jgi:predicted acyl esterase
MDRPALQNAMPSQPRPGFRWVRWVALATRVLGLRTLLTQAAESTATTPTPQAVRMRDGIELLTDVYLPEVPPPFPVVLLRSPYSKAYALIPWTLRQHSRSHIGSPSAL